MSIDEFLFECNRSPALQEYRDDKHPITYQTLKQADFIKPTYNVELLGLLSRKLFFVNPTKAEGVELNAKTYKNLRHLETVNKRFGQKLVKSERKKLGLPFPNRGLSTDDDTEYREWFNSFGFEPIVDTTNPSKLFTDLHSTQNIVKAQVEASVQTILKAWQLPNRYSDAVTQLVLFNRVITASNGATRSLTWIERNGKTERLEGENYDIDTTYEDRTHLMKLDVFGIKKNRLATMPGKVTSAPRQLEETNGLIQRYNELKGEGREGAKSDKQIFEQIGRECTMKPRTIQKRIKGY